jgi:hypothetical protein
MMLTDFGDCPICGALLQQIASSPLTVSCPSGHYKMCFTTAGGTAGTSTISLKQSVVEVPKAFQDAFADKEVLDP